MWVCGGGDEVHDLCVYGVVCVWVYRMSIHCMGYGGWGVYTWCLYCVCIVRRSTCGSYCMCTPITFIRICARWTEGNNEMDSVHVCRCHEIN